jgi:hypothetical protein
MYYYLLILAVAAGRLVELVVSRRNAAWSIAQGGREFGGGHYPVMVAMHTLLLVGCVVEVWAMHRPFIPWLGWPMLFVVVLSTVIRWWCATVLGKHWNPRDRRPECPTGPTGSISMVAPPQLHGGGRGGGGATSRAFGVADRARLHHLQRSGTDGADPNREQGPGVHVRRQ